MERWFIVGSVIAIFLMLAVAGWHFQQINESLTGHSSTGICASAAAHCGELRL